MGGLKGMLAAEAVREQIEETNAKNAAETPDSDYEMIAYRVVLHNGLALEVESREEPTSIFKVWAEARKKDALVQWNDGEATEAKQISHIAVVLEEEEDEGVPAQPTESTKPAGEGAANE